MTRFPLLGTRALLQLIVLGCLLPSGCASIQDCHYERSQHFRSLVAYHQAGGQYRGNFRSDYRRGWIDGYYEVVTGGPDCPPAIAPKRYWNPKQVLNDRGNRRNAYYSGWQDGAARASTVPDTHHLKVFESAECSLKRCDCGPTSCQCQTTETVIQVDPAADDSLPISMRIESLPIEAPTIQTPLIGSPMLIHESP